MDQKYTKDLYSTFVIYGNYAIYGIILSFVSVEAT